MYLFDARRLRADLAEDRVSQADFAIYAFLVSGVSLPFWVQYTETEASWIDWAFFFAHLLVAALGTRASYVANGGRAGSQFLNRFISLGWVVGVRVALAVIIPLILLSFVLSEVAPATVAGPVMSASFVVAEAFYFWRLSLHVASVPSARPAAA